VAIVATVGAAALIGYVYSIMFNRFHAPKLSSPPATSWPSWVPSGQGSASMSRSTAVFGSLATSVSTTGAVLRRVRLGGTHPADEFHGHAGHLQLGLRLDDSLAGRGSSAFSALISPGSWLRLVRSGRHQLWIE
jgi:hypothetical protein